MQNYFSFVRVKVSPAVNIDTLHNVYFSRDIAMMCKTRRIKAILTPRLNL